MDTPQCTLSLEIITQPDPSQTAITTPAPSSTNPQPAVAGLDAQASKPKQEQELSQAAQARLNTSASHWSNEDIQKLLQICTAYNDSVEAGNPPYPHIEHWTVVAAQFEGRSAAACRKRWSRSVAGGARHGSVATNSSNMTHAENATPDSSQVFEQPSSFSATFNTSTVQEDKPDAVENHVENEAPKLASSISRANDWGAEEDAHYMRLVKDERHSSQHIDATSKESFWLAVQQKLDALGYIRSVASLRSRWYFKMHQTPKAEGRAGADIGAIVARYRRGRLGLPNDGKLKESHTDIVDIAGGDADQSAADTARKDNSRILRKRNPPLADFFDDSSDEGPPPLQKARAADSLRRKSMPQQDQSHKATLGSSDAPTPSMASPSLAPARSPVNPDDHAFAVRKISTFNNEIQILGAQKNGHLMILEDVETRLAQLRQIKAGVEKKLKSLADQEKELLSERNFKTAEIEDVEGKIKDTEEGRDAWTATLKFC